MKHLIYVLLVMFLINKPALANTSQLLQLIDYIGVDYSEAINNGQVINEAEYAEMHDFAAGILQHINDLPEHKIKHELIKQSEKLSVLIKQKAASDQIRQLTAQMHQKIVSAFNIVVVPRKQPDLNKAQQLYAEQCASCHGVDGYGDGPASKGMEPPPINFRDVERYKHRTLYGLHSTITQGVSDTAMESYSHLSDDDRWSLSFYVGGLAVSPEKIALEKSALHDLKKLTTTTPDQAQHLYGQAGISAMAYLRHHPEALFDTTSNLDFAHQRLDDVIEAYNSNQHKKAYQYAVEAYLEGFELSEQNITALDKELKLEIENLMTSLRNKIRKGKSSAIIEADINLIQSKLNDANELLNSTSLSGEAAFASAFFILLREGLEAILIVAALAAFLVKTNRKDGLAYIHIGWVSALFLGVLTWWASVSLINISGASREITEGIAAIVATIVLLYVGFWMHDKTSAAKWKKFIDDRMHKALTSGTLWTLAGLSFIAVYREAFETILFYQALWAQTNEAGKTMGLSGFISAVLLLAVLAWLIMRYSVRLPLRQFFAITGGLMFVLAVIFAGKGISALQEAGIIMSTPVNFIRIDLLGVYPNLQGLLVQAGLIIIAIILWNKKSASKPTEGQN